MAIVLALSCLSILSSCSKKEEPKELSFPVDIAEVLQMDVPIYLKGIGTLEASSVVYIRPQVSGILTDVLYEEGSFVKKDDLLITIDSRMYEANLEIARAMLSSEEADYRLNYDITRRMANLVGENYVSEVEYEKSLTRLEGSHANIEKTHAEIKKAEIDLSYTQIYSPISGYIGEKHFDKGNYVTPGDHHALVVINKVTPLEVAFSLPSTYLDQLREKQKERPLYLMCERASKGKPIDGVLDFIDNEVNKHTGMIPLKGIIPNKDERGWPGEFVRVHLLLETLENATVVPTEAIVIGQDEDFVWVVNEETMRVELRSIKKVMEFEHVTVVESGVKKDEVVVIDGQLNLTPDALVHTPKGKVDG